MGGLGHLAMQYARHLGLRTVAVDVSDEKLAFAGKLGAEAVARPGDARQVIVKQLGGADAAIVFTASAAAVPVAFSSLKRQGSLILVGLTGDRYSLPVSETVLKGIRVQGSYLGTRADLEEAFALAAAGVARPEVTTHELDEAPVLIQRLKDGLITGRAVVTF
jgi:propanol-preferring alcohol dehydrogenase